MKQYCTYFKLECKRIFRLLPGMVLITLLLFLAGGIFFMKYTAGDSAQDDQQLKTINIGLVYSEEDKKFLGVGFYMLEHTDELGYICNFKEVSRQEGQQLLTKEELDVLILFPDDYVRNMYNGIEEPVTLRFGSAQSGISSLMFRQLSDTVTNYMIESRAGIYTLQDMYRLWKLPFSKDSDRIIGEYILRILERDGILEHQSVNATDGLDSVMYYICVGIVLLLLFWGLSCGCVLGNNQKILPRLLKRRNLSVSAQYFAKYAALMLFFISTYSITTILILLFGQIAGIPEIPVFSCIKIFPVLFLLCSMVLCIYELSRDGMSGMVFFFFATLILSFISGFFYPLSYFPLWTQQIGKWLPTRIMLDYVTGCFKTNIPFVTFLKMILYTLFFMIITIVFTENYYKIITF